MIQRLQDLNLLLEAVDYPTVDMQIARSHLARE
jgi:hypothetical protein